MTIGPKRRDGYIRCTKCKQLLIPLSPRNVVPTHERRRSVHVGGSPLSPMDTCTRCWGAGPHGGEGA